MLEEGAGVGVVSAGAVVIESRDGVPVPPGVRESVRQRALLQHDAPEFCSFFFRNEHNHSFKLVAMPIMPSINCLIITITYQTDNAPKKHIEPNMIKLVLPRKAISFINKTDEISPYLAYKSVKRHEKDIRNIIEVYINELAYGRILI